MRSSARFSAPASWSRTTFSSGQIVLYAATRAPALNRRGNIASVARRDEPPVIALCEIAAGAVDRIRFRQRLLKLQRDDVEEDHEPDGQIGMAGPSAKSFVTTPTRSPPKVPPRPLPLRGEHH